MRVAQAEMTTYAAEGVPCPTGTRMPAVGARSARTAHVHRGRLRGDRAGRVVKGAVLNVRLFLLGRLLVAWEADGHALNLCRRLLHLWTKRATRSEHFAVREVVLHLVAQLLGCWHWTRQPVNAELRVVNAML